MKKHAFILTVLLGGFLVTPSLLAQVVLTRNFDFTNDTIYEAGKTIVGVTDNGAKWSKVTIDGPDTDAGIISPSNGNLFMVTSTSAGTNYRTSVRTSFTEISSASKVVYVSVSMGWVGLGNQGAIIAFGNQDWDVPLTLGFTTNNGIAVGGSSTTSLLSFSDTINTLDSGNPFLYQFDLKLDYANRVFDVRIQGKDKNDNVIDSTFSNLAFQTGTPINEKGLSKLYIGNTGGNYKQMYIEHINMSNIPEPSVVTALALATLLFLLVRRKKSNGHA